MKPHFNIDDKTYAQLMNGLNGLFLVEKKGNASDFRLYFEDKWLADTAVIEHLHRFKGEWAVHLVFASVINPLLFIKRYIVSHTCAQRAAQKAHYMRRLAAKDQRGTLEVNIGQFNLCHN